MTVTTAIAEANAHDVPDVTRLLSSLGVNNHHLLWLHKRGRADGGGRDLTPPVERVIEVVRAAKAVAKACGITIDNDEAIRQRLKGPIGTKRDLAGACVSSLCVYSDGKVYPSAAMANVPELCLGDLASAPLETLWRDSPVARRFRETTVETKEHCPSCPLKFLCGGGDIEHAYFYGGHLGAHDPYCELHKAMFMGAMESLADERGRFVSNGKSGFNAPVILAGMGENAVTCATGEAPRQVETSHSTCVLSFDIDAPRKMVRDFYGEAAEKPQETLCCPVRPMAEDLAHIPPEVVERFYGCGSPVADAGIVAGETTLDLGSGAGIDVFIAARRVGPTGRAIGVDMTDRMLAVAHEYKPVVARNLGYDVVEFREGFLEQVPVEDRSVDLVTSNCVVNLSPDKKRVFAEIWRVLKDHGRLVLADIVSEEEVPAHQRRDPRLWGECISGALTEEELLAYLERAGFYGLRILKKTFWKEVEGHRFFSVTVRGYKFEKTTGCIFVGQQAIYQGPFKGISDEEGHWFPRGTAVEVCTDTAAKLSHAPYAGQFVVTHPGRAARAEDPCCTPDGNGQKCC
ncbi:MAG: methyltransferase domain-containing protein [Planctomycetes bacterium]|nr:methyltransferase domain-containing protein [Planctomycetota bacterium]